jgi:hypothetical protein
MESLEYDPILLEFAKKGEQLAVEIPNLIQSGRMVEYEIALIVLHQAIELILKASCLKRDINIWREGTTTICFGDAMKKGGKGHLEKDDLKYLAALNQIRNTLQHGAMFDVRIPKDWLLWRCLQTTSKLLTKIGIDSDEMPLVVEKLAEILNQKSEGDLIERKIRLTDELDDIEPFQVLVKKLDLEPYDIMLLTSLRNQVVHGRNPEFGELEEMWVRERIIPAVLEYSRSDVSFNSSEFQKRALAWLSGIAHPDFEMSEEVRYPMGSKRIILDAMLKHDEINVVVETKYAAKSELIEFVRLRGFEQLQTYTLVTGSRFGILLLPGSEIHYLSINDFDVPRFMLIVGIDTDPSLTKEWLSKCIEANIDSENLASISVDADKFSFFFKQDSAN